MDQLRKVLGWLKRQHFWVLSVLVAVIALGCWWSASGALRKEFEASKSAIEAEFTSMNSIKGKPFLPNDVINTRQGEETKKQSDEVAKVWQRLYDRQREDVLEWPSALSEEFRNKVAQLKFGDEITPEHLLDNYQNYAERYFPNLPAIVGARALSEEELASQGGYGGGRGEGYLGGGGRGGYGAEGMQMTVNGQLEDEDKYLCEWMDQAVVRGQLNFPQRPSSMSVWVTQENLWVYKSLLTVIKNTNAAAGATRRSNSVVRTIYSLEIGSRAAPYSRNKGRLYMLPTAAPAGGDPLAAGGMEGTADLGMAEGGGGGRYGEMGMGGEGGMEGRGGFGGGYGGQGPMSKEAERGMLLSFRYLDSAGQPIAVGGGGDPAAGGDMAVPDAAAAPASTGSPEDFGLEYKRLPVRMCLQMDQRWLTHLITECANQPLQVEVQEVRINPPDFAAGGGGMGGYGGFGGGRGGYEGGGGGFGGANASIFTERTGIQTFSAYPNRVNVVIQGIIYIFNPPNKERLSTGESTEPLAVTN